MNLIDLPEELLILITKKLDFHTQFNLYQTCSAFQKILCSYGVIKSCNLSQSTLATVQTLKHDIILNVSCHLEELILCALPDLSKRALVPIIRKLKSLKTLDVSYTNIIIPDLIDMYQVCPTIKNICINLSFGVKTNHHKIPFEIFCNLFSNFKNISFVGSPYNLIFSKLTNYLLAKTSSLVNVKLTVIKCEHPVFETTSICKYFREKFQDNYNFNQLFLFLLDWTKYNDMCFGNLNNFNIISYLKSSNTEYFVIKRDDNFGVSYVYVSTAFIGFFLKNFHNTTENMIVEDNQTDLNKIKLKENAVIMIWNKASTIFDESFYSKVVEYVRDFFPSHYESPKNDVTVISNENDWNLITVSTVSNLEPQQLIQEKESHVLVKKKRIAPTTYILNYDNMFKDNSNIKLSIRFLALTYTVKLSPSSEYLKKITYLSLSGQTFFGNDFFKVLFQYCIKIETLNIELSCSSYIGNSINLSSSLKNFRLEEKSINYNALIKGLCGCPSLENIHLFDKASNRADLSNICEIVENNNKLHSLFVQASMADSIRLKVSRRLKESKSRCGKPYLNIELSSHFMAYSYGPFIDVFKLNPLRQI